MSTHTFLRHRDDHRRSKFRWKTGSKLPFSAWQSMLPWRRIQSRQAPSELRSRESVGLSGRSEPAIWGCDAQNSRPVIALLLLWTIASALFSEASDQCRQAAGIVVRVSLLSCPSDTHAHIGARTARTTYCLWFGRCAYSSFDLLRGRGVVVESIAANSPCKSWASSRRYHLADQSSSRLFDK